MWVLIITIWVNSVAMPVDVRMHFQTEDECMAIGALTGAGVPVGVEYDASASWHCVAAKRVL
jgi:hypothetical protein